MYSEVCWKSVGPYKAVYEEGLRKVAFVTFARIYLLREIIYITQGKKQKLKKLIKNIIFNKNVVKGRGHTALILLFFLLAPKSPLWAKSFSP